MTKQKFLTSTLCAGLLGMSLSAMAQDESGFTFGIDYGHTEAKKYCDNIVTCDDTGKGPKVEFGYEFNKTFGVELGYTSFGTVFDADDNSLRVKQESNAITLSVLGSVPIGDYFGIYGRVGYARYDTNNSGAVEGVALKDESGNTPLWGAGIKFNVSEQWAIRVEYQNYSDLSDRPGRQDDVKGLFAGGVYRF